VTSTTSTTRRSPEDRFEVPIGERIAEIRARKKDERAARQGQGREEGREAAGGSSGQSGTSSRRSDGSAARNGRGGRPDTAPAQSAAA
jgi:ATP-dependent RNA helicase RhlE